MAYIQRKFIEEHLLECPKKRMNNSAARDDDRDDEYFVLEQNITLLRSALHEEIRQRHRLISDVGALKRSVFEEAEKRLVNAESFQRELANLSRQYKVE